MWSDVSAQLYILGKDDHVHFQLHKWIQKSAVILHEWHWCILNVHVIRVVLKTLGLTGWNICTVLLWFDFMFTWKCSLKYLDFALVWFWQCCINIIHYYSFKTIFSFWCIYFKAASLKYYVNINNTAPYWRGQRDELPQTSSTHLLIWTFCSWCFLAKEYVLIVSCWALCTPYCLLWNLTLNFEWLKVFKVVSLMINECELNHTDHMLDYDEYWFPHQSDTSKIILPELICTYTCTANGKKMNHI